ncbi:SDR family oxidoreductase [Alsobacter sp. SYSU M60028]|uniref:SDR family oxidoreductase n=1 Tax=Alsobacter ponti TaxID=2962936 RepID=A0ABT1LBS9_9HYPH|nr:SDR family oxidoreductase [Alsobacter ponti]MCP8938947.1 SDR family oxidoreductase [Alsobacter ponti]
MAVSLKPLSEQTIVITGATSGIGLATAREAARRGARLVLMARGRPALQDVAADLERGGAQVEIVQGDVGRREDVQQACEAAMRRFGGFDTWVNNAGVSIWGRLMQVTDDDHRRLFDTNFWGVVHGSTVAAAHLRRKGGAIVNLGSVASDVSLPIQGMYAASKHAVKGFTDALRMELEEEGAPVSVTLIKPTSIDTPFPQNARNYTGHEPRLPAPAYAPEEAAYAILQAAEHPARDIYVGGAGRLMTGLGTLAPRMMDMYGETRAVREQLRPGQAHDPEGALHRPTRHGGEVRGHQPGPVFNRSLYTRAALHPVASLVVAAGVAAAASALMGAGRRRDAGRPAPARPTPPYRPARPTGVAGRREEDPSREDNWHTGP